MLSHPAQPFPLRLILLHSEKIFWLLINYNWFTNNYNMLHPKTLAVIWRFVVYIPTKEKRNILNNLSFEIFVSVLFQRWGSGNFFLAYLAECFIWEKLDRSRGSNKVKERREAINSRIHLFGFDDKQETCLLKMDYTIQCNKWLVSLKPIVGKFENNRNVQDIRI